MIRTAAILSMHRPHSARAAGFEDGDLFGFNDAILTCLEFATGNVTWRDRRVGSGWMTSADGHLHIFSARGTSRNGRRRLARERALRLSRHGPVVSDGRLCVRNQDALLVYDVETRSTP
jgi:hypothetical protein